RMAALERVARSPEAPEGRASGAAGASIMASRPVADGRASRVIIVEVSAIGAVTAWPTPDDEATLHAALAPLAKRLRIAFGEDPLAPRQMLTPRERDVLSVLITGMSVREIASSLSRSPHTVHDYVKSLHRKLSASSRGGLVARALGRPIVEARDESHGGEQ